MRMLLFVTIMALALFAGPIQAANYTVVVPLSDEVVLSDEATRSGQTNAELIQDVIDAYLSERRGHYESPKERLGRLSDAEKALIPTAIRSKLGLE